MTDDRAAKITSDKSKIVRRSIGRRNRLKLGKETKNKIKLLKTKKEEGDLK